MAIITVNEGKRGCGYRKPGGLYLTCAGVGQHCGKLPIPLDVCPTCGNGIEFSRGWTWVNGTAIAASKPCKRSTQWGDPKFAETSGCPLGGPLGRCGLLWIGAKFYPTPDDWTKEANSKGVSRRIKSVPKGFELGTTWVLVAHVHAIINRDGSKSPAIFHAFKPSRIEYVVTGKETPEDVDAMEGRGITPVQVEYADDQPALPLS